MALVEKDGQYYGDAQADVRDCLRQYSADEQPAEHFADAVCSCGSRQFQLAIDEESRVAARLCTACENERVMADGDARIEQAELEICECLCGADVFEITLGIAVDTDRQNASWLYVGCRCVTCGLAGCYGDWQHETGDYQTVLDNT
jgi:hypothetical protein